MPKVLWNFDVANVEDPKDLIRISNFPVVLRTYAPSFLSTKTSLKIGSQSRSQSRRWKAWASVSTQDSMDADVLPEADELNYPNRRKVCSIQRAIAIVTQITDQFASKGCMRMSRNNWMSLAALRRTHRLLLETISKQTTIRFNCSHQTISLLKSSHTSLFLNAWFVSGSNEQNCDCLS